MYKKFIMLISSIVIVGIIIYCFNTLEVSKNSSDVTDMQVVIVYQIDDSSVYPVEVIESNDISELLEMFVDLNFEITSEPMNYPRFKVEIHKSNGEITHWNLDANQIISNSETLGNHKIASGTLFDTLFNFYNKIK